MSSAGKRIYFLFATNGKSRISLKRRSIYFLLQSFVGLKQEVREHGLTQGANSAQIQPDGSTNHQVCQKLAFKLSNSWLNGFIKKVSRLYVQLASIAVIVSSVLRSVAGLDCVGRKIHDGTGCQTRTTFHFCLTAFISLYCLSLTHFNNKVPLSAKSTAMR